VLESPIRIGHAINLASMVRIRKMAVPKVGKYRELQHSGFYSRNWVELAEVIEDELKEILGTENDC